MNTTACPDQMAFGKVSHTHFLAESVTLGISRCYHCVPGHAPHWNHQSPTSQCLGTADLQDKATKMTLSMELASSKSARQDIFISGRASESCTATCLISNSVGNLRI